MAVRLCRAHHIGEWKCGGNSRPAVLDRVFFPQQLAHLKLNVCIRSHFCLLSFWKHREELPNALSSLLLPFVYSSIRPSVLLISHLSHA